MKRSFENDYECIQTGAGKGKDPSLIYANETNATTV
jgi:hypothetical protein